MSSLFWYPRRRVCMYLRCGVYCRTYGLLTTARDKACDLGRCAMPLDLQPREKLTDKENPSDSILSFLYTRQLILVCHCLRHATRCELNPEFVRVRVRLRSGASPHSKVRLPSTLQHLTTLSYTLHACILPGIARASHHLNHVFVRSRYSGRPGFPQQPHRQLLLP